MIAGDRAAEDGSKQACPCQAVAARLVTHARDTHLATFYRQRTPAPTRRAAATTSCARSQNGGGRPGCFLSDNQNVVIVRLILRRTQHTRACKPVPCGDHALLKLSHISKPFSSLYVLLSGRRCACADASSSSDEQSLVMCRLVF